MRLALALVRGFSVDVHCGPDIGLAHQLLLHLERSSSLVKQTPKGVPEGVPANVTDAAAALSEAATASCCLEGTRENPILRLRELRSASPLQQDFGERRIERHTRA